jgi:hypothetical protein
LELEWLSATLKQIVKEAFEGSQEAFINLVDGVVQSARSRRDCRAGVEVSGKLVNIKAAGEAIVFGDLHGDFESLINILEDSDALRKMGKFADRYLIFLGDYGDRGLFSVEVYWVILKLKALFPDQIILLRGNHEGPEDLLPIPHDLPTRIQDRFGKHWHVVYSELRKLFDSLLNAVAVEGRYLMLHGGPPTGASSICDLAFLESNRKKRDAILQELLWNDPNEGTNETVDSLRGAGKLFSKKLTRETLKMFGANVLIRGHEPCEDGFKISHEGQILTLFSRKGSPYFNSYGAYLDVPLEYVPKDAHQLIPYIHKF